VVLRVEHAPSKPIGWFRFPVVLYRTLKTVLSAYAASCSALMGECKETIHTRCCHFLDASATFTAKAAACSTAQASGEGRRRPFMTVQKE